MQLLVGAVLIAGLVMECAATVLPVQPEEATCYTNFITFDPMSYSPFIGLKKSYSRSPYKYGSVTDCDFTDDPGPPDSVHTLSPRYVDVVAAMGDSITAGIGIRGNLIESFQEYKGFSWSIGGRRTLETVTTLPNIIKKYNPNLTGMSYRTTPSAMVENLNRAVSGAKAQDMLCEVEDLVGAFEAQGVSDAMWKVITIFIGGNDVCSDAVLEPDKLIRNYTIELMTALDYLHEHVQNAFVNLVGMIDIGLLAETHSEENAEQEDCLTFHNQFCNYSTRIPALARYVSDGLRDGIDCVLNTGRYDRNDFTVVMQPFFTETEMPRDENGLPDMDYFGPDCFHFSEQAHRRAAIALWNSMLGKVGDKSNSVDWDDDTIHCPSQSFPYFYTYLNSGLQTEGSIVDCFKD